MVATWPAAHPESGALSGWLAIVAGSVRGTGRALAERSSAEGAAVAGLDWVEIAGGGGFVIYLAARSTFVTGTDLVNDGAPSLG